jgi:hypothetical protein
MNAAELEALILGLLRLWQAHGSVSVTRDADALTAVVQGDSISVRVERSVQPFGVVWQLQAEGERRLTYPSIIGCIRHLRETFAPARGSSRVVFAASGGGAS